MSAAVSQAAVRRPSRRSRRRRRSRVVVRVLLVAVLALVVGLGSFVGGLLAAPIDLAVPPPPKSALLLAADGRQFATIPPPERREVVPADQIPDVMREAIISAEDERFLQHKGVDPLATVRAAFRDLTGGVAQGGSTLTQQYVKNVYVGNERSALRKVREAALAVRLERMYSKQQILTDYLNALYLGNGLYGVQAASKYYFGVPVKDLDLDARTRRRDPVLGLARASILAGIAPAPSVWNPVKDFATARARQQYTLNRMVVGGYATPQEASNAFSKDVRPLQVSPAEAVSSAPEFADLVKARLKDKYADDEDVFFRGGLRVRTTLDLDLQQAVAQAAKEVLPGRDDPQVAVTAVDYRNGDVKAMTTLRRVPQVVDADGKQYTAAVDGYQPKVGFNLSTNAQRSTGSTIKPFTLAVALEQGQTLETSRYAPNTDSIPNPGGKPNPYVYSNSDVSEAGTFTLRRALADSINTVFVPLAKEVGRGKVADLAKKAGLRGDINPGNLSFGIGAGVDVTPLSEASAYGTFANGGVHVPPRYYSEIRTGGSGTDPGMVFDTVPGGTGARVVPGPVANDVVTAMTDVVTRGTATKVVGGLPYATFGKTGTTDNSTDAWFTGCIPDQHLCISTWLGYEYKACSFTAPPEVKGGPERRVHVVGSSCGGMHDLGGTSGQIFGGTVPAKIFRRSLEIVAEVRAARAARASGAVPVPTLSPTPSPAPDPTATRRRRRRVVPLPTTAATRTVAPTTAPTPAPPGRPTTAPTTAPTRAAPTGAPAPTRSP